MTRSADWIEALRAERDKTSLPRIAGRLGLSATTVHQILKGNYRGNVKRIEERVRGELLNQTVQCPELGEMNARQCQDWQAKPFAATNPTRVAMWRACRSGCKHSNLKERI